MASRLATLTRNLNLVGLGLALTISLSAEIARGQASAQQNSMAYQVGVIPSINVVASPVKPIVKPVHQIPIDESGILRGQVTNHNHDDVEGLRVFALQSQSIVQSATTDENGEFILSHIRPGNYSLLVAGKHRLAAKGISVVEQANHSLRPDSKVKMSLVDTGYEGIQELIETTLNEKLASAVTENPAGSISTHLGDEPESNRIRIINGSLRGQISSLTAAEDAEAVQVFLIQNEQPVYQVQTNALGAFLVPDIEPGVYDFVAVGKTGFAALRFEALGISATQLISFSENINSLLEVSLAEFSKSSATAKLEPVSEPSQDAISYSVERNVMMEPAYINPTTGPIQYASESIACGCSSGATGALYGNYSNFASPGMMGGRFGGRFGTRFHGGLGGAGRFGGLLQSGAGFGRLITLGALGGSVIAIANDNDPEPASPITN